eukprot:TRINITY_DN3560_c0_g1_i1.p2 TRINITY_DN3560_c0_g1~~TRINITY_DN3560_c0_g1_i1.p2  ORF type:complete len:116 (+),score=19.56 TRINITY_DN3560_c0_g1_i1:25-348(+)
MLIKAGAVDSDSYYGTAAETAELFENEAVKRLIERRCAVCGVPCTRVCVCKQTAYCGKPCQAKTTVGWYRRCSAADAPRWSSSVKAAVLIRLARPDVRSPSTVGSLP